MVCLKEIKIGARWTNLSKLLRSYQNVLFSYSDVVTALVRQKYWEGGATLGRGGPIRGTQIWWYVWIRQKSMLNELIWRNFWGSTKMSCFQELYWQGKNVEWKEESRAMDTQWKELFNQRWGVSVFVKHDSISESDQICDK